MFSVSEFRTRCVAIAAVFVAVCGTAGAQRVSTDTRNLLPVGADRGGVANVYQSTIDGLGVLLETLTPFGPTFRGGVRVAVGDVNGDGVMDIVVGAGPGGGPHVIVFDGVGITDGTSNTILYSFFAFDPPFRGGVNVAAGDVNGDGKADIIVGAGPGAGSHVKVFSGNTGAELRSFFAYDPAFQGGVNVAAGDLSGDGAAEIVTGAGAGGGPHVKVFDGATNSVSLSFFAFDPSAKGGVYVAAGDVTGDGRPDIVAGAGEGLPLIKVFNAVGDPFISFMAFDQKAKGVRVGLADPAGHRPLVISGATSNGGGIPAYFISAAPVRGRFPVKFFDVHKEAVVETMFGGIFPFGAAWSKGMFVAP